MSIKSISNIDSKKLSPDEVDVLIVDKIEKVTSENSDIWTCPEFNRREYVHSFFQYPAMMIPVVQKKLIEIIIEAKPDIKNMVDPFMGSATTFVASMENGLNCYGQDVNPLAILIAEARTGPYYIEALKKKYEILLEKIDVDNSVKIEAKFNNRTKWFKDKVSITLSKIVRAIRQEEQRAIRRFFWIVLAETVRLSSNDRTSTFKLHARKQEEIDRRNFSALDVFKLHMDKSIEDFELHAKLIKESGQLVNGNYTNKIDITLQDSKQAIYSPTAAPYYDLLVTSPPYGDNKTTVPYGQHSYLPLQWIDHKDIRTKIDNEFLKTTSEIDSRSLGGKLKVGNDEQALHQLFLKSPTFQNTYETIKSISSTKALKVAAFIYDLSLTIDNIFSVMKKDSYQIWTSGNRCVAKIEVPNDEIITELITNKGGRLVTKVRREIINKRMARRNKETALMNNEDILIFRKID